MEIRYNNSLGTANMIKTANNFDTFHASRTGPYNFQFNFITGTRGRVRARSFIPHCFVPTNENAIYMYVYMRVYFVSVKKKKIQIYRFISAIPLSNEYLRHSSPPASTPICREK